MSSSRDHFVDLFEYTRWANQLMLGVLASTIPDHEEGDTEMLRLMNHIVAAQEVWLGRVQGTVAPRGPIWPDGDLSMCEERAGASHRGWLSFLAGCREADFGQPVPHVNSRGVKYASTLREIATHVVNHGTHHRAQVACLLRKAGAVPPASDYIFYVR